MHRRILHNGVMRSFRVDLPPDWLRIPDLPTEDPLRPFRAAIPLPVVVFFHGGNSSIDRTVDLADFQAIPRLSDTPGVPVADADKFMEDAPRRWVGSAFGSSRRGAALTNGTLSTRCASFSSSARFDGRRVA